MKGNWNAIMFPVVLHAGHQLIDRGIEDSPNSTGGSLGSLGSGSRLTADWESMVFQGLGSRNGSAAHDR